MTHNLWVIKYIQPVIRNFLKPSFSKRSRNDVIFSANYFLLLSPRMGPSNRFRDQFIFFVRIWYRPNQIINLIIPNQSHCQNWCWNIFQLWFLFALFWLFFQHHAWTTYLIRLSTLADRFVSRHLATEIDHLWRFLKCAKKSVTE